MKVSRLSPGKNVVKSHFAYGFSIEANIELNFENFGRPLGWFKSMTCHQQALFLAFLSEDIASDPDIHRDELLESLSPGIILNSEPKP